MLQELALRAVSSNKTATGKQLLEWAKLLSLENRRLQDILILIFIVKHNLVPKIMSDIILNIIYVTKISPSLGFVPKYGKSGQT